MKAGTGIPNHCCIEDLAHGTRDFESLGSSCHRVMGLIPSIWAATPHAGISQLDGIGYIEKPSLIAASTRSWICTYLTPCHDPIAMSTIATRGS